MKVLHVIPSLAAVRGGPSFVLKTLAGALASAGVETHVAATNDNGPGLLDVPLEQPVVESGVTYRYFARQALFYTVSMPLARWLSRNLSSYDLVHIHAVFSFPSIAASWVARGAGVPYIFRPAGILNRWGLENRRPLLKKASFALLERGLLEASAAVQYTSQQERDEAEALGFRARAAIIPNPVPEAPPPVAGRDPDAAPRFVFCSRIDPKKGLDQLLPAFAEVEKQHPGATLEIAGSGEPGYEASLREMAARLGLRGIRWLGFVNGAAKWNLLGGADVFVLPSYSENFGVAVVEAMMCGLPVVVTDGVGIHDAIRAADAGLVTKAAAAPLAAAMKELAASAGLRRRLGGNALSLARSEYSVPAVAARVIALYESVLAARGAAEAGAEPRLVQS